MSLRLRAVAISTARTATWITREITIYLLQPKVMSREVICALVRGIKAHRARHGVTETVFVLHGGEPLLAGPEFFKMLVSEVRGSFSARDCSPFHHANEQDSSFGRMD
jgi:hypothetical protein